jgi:hypothetical protein
LNFGNVQFDAFANVEAIKFSESSRGRIAGAQTTIIRGLLGLPAWHFGFCAAFSLSIRLAGIGLGGAT